MKFMHVCAVVACLTFVLVFVRQVPSEMPTLFCVGALARGGCGTRALEPGQMGNARSIAGCHYIYGK